MKLLTLSVCLFAVTLLVGSAFAADNDIEKRVENGYADSGGVKIHYAALGDKKNPLIVMIHGFPDFWYTWRNQMIALMSKYQVAAIDLRGYNLSDKPQGGEYYLMRHLISDIQAVMRHLEKDKAIILLIQ
jgi:epoxide hydrolase 4